MVEFKEKDSKKEITVSDYPLGSKLIGEEGESNELKIFIDEYKGLHHSFKALFEEVRLH